LFLIPDASTGMLPANYGLRGPGVSSGGQPTRSGTPIRLLGRYRDTFHGQMKHVTKYQ